MLHIFICPECRSEHAEPADAHFLLAVLCFDCTLELELHELRRNCERLPAAAAA